MCVCAQQAEWAGLEENLLFTLVVSAITNFGLAWTASADYQASVQHLEVTQRIVIRYHIM